MALPTLLTTTTFGLLFLMLTCTITPATAAPRPSISEILLPTPDVTGGPAGEIKCYALPYGAIGIISHLLTFWTIAWMAWGRAPLWPINHMDKSMFDLLLAIVSLCTCIAVGSMTMYRCRLSWHFLLISIWKLVTSVSVACIAIHRCLILRREDRRPSPPSHESVFQHEDYSSGYLLQSPYPRPSNGPRQISQSSDIHPRNSKKTNLAPLHWLFLYLAGTVVGMTGLCSLLWTSFREDKAVQHLTYGFAAPMVIIPVLVAIYWYGEHCFGGTSGCCGLLTAYEHTFKSACVAFVVMFGFLSALYGDLILGVIADNVTGFPSSDIAPLYWVWFIAKRVPMLSI